MTDRSAVKQQCTIFIRAFPVTIFQIDIILLCENFYLSLWTTCGLFGSRKCETWLLIVWFIIRPEMFEILTHLKSSFCKHELPELPSGGING
jgi:hypothetical protein